jgi:hypothetical protein
MKKQRIIFIFLKMILFLLLLVFFYFQFKKINWNAETVYLEKPFFVLFALLLVPVNWFFEWLKWLFTVRVLQITVSRQTQKHAFLAGIVSGMLTPNMLGNFIGRIYYFERKYRVPLIILTLATNYAQFLASIIFGIVAIIILNVVPFEVDLSQLHVILYFVAFILLLIYFNFELLFKLVKNKTHLHLLIRKLTNRRSYRWKILLLSILRHFVFSIQFILVLHAFGIEFSVWNILWVWQVYLWVTLMPSLFMGKLAIRETISIWVLGFAGMGEISVLIASFLIWIMNLLIPTLIGLIVCKRKV